MDREELKKRCCSKCLHCFDHWSHFDWLPYGPIQPCKPKFRYYCNEIKSYVKGDNVRPCFKTR